MLRTIVVSTQMPVRIQVTSFQSANFTNRTIA